MAQLALKMALSHSDDRHIPFFDGTVLPERIELTVLEVGKWFLRKHGGDRHARMLQKREFNICEVSLSSNLMAKAGRCRSRRFRSFPAGCMEGMKVNFEVQARNGIISIPLPAPEKPIDLSYLKQAQKELAINIRGVILNLPHSTSSELDPWSRADLRLCVFDAL